MPEFELAMIDYAIIIGYFIICLFIGWWYGRGHDTADSYFLAGRTLPWYLIGFSLYASNMSGSSFVGLMGATYDNGMVVFNYEWTATLVLIVFAFFMLPYFLKARIATIPEFLERRFDRRSRLAYSLFTVLAIVFIDTAGALYAGGLVISTLLPEVSMWSAVITLGLVVGVYTLYGGLESVVVADAIQAVLLIIGAAIVFWLGMDKIGGWDALMEALPEEKTRLIAPADDSFLPWPGIIGVVMLGFYYWTLNQFIAQRALGAKSLDEGKKGALFAGFLKLPNLFLMIIPGLIALALYPNLERADMAFPVLTVDLLPVGLRGLVLTALVAAIMSSLSSALNAAATLVTLDFIREKKPELNDKSLVTIGRILTGLFMVIGICYAPFIGNFETLFEYVQSALAYIVPAVVATYFYGIFSRKATPTAAYWMVLIGLIGGVTLFILKEVPDSNGTTVWASHALPDAHYTIMALVMFSFSLFMGWFISLLGGEKAREQGDISYCYDPKVMLGASVGFTKPYWRNVNLQAVILLLGMVAMIVYLA